MRYNAEDVFSSSPLSALAPSPRKPRDTRDWPTRLEEEEEEEDLPESSGAGARRAADRLAAALAGKEEGTGTEKGASRDLPEEEEAKEYEVERILGRKEHRGEIRYKIRWKGYSPSDDTWEPVENITAKSLIEDYEKQAAGAQRRDASQGKGKKRKASAAPESRSRKIKQEKASPSTSAATLPSVPEADSGARRRKRGRPDELSRSEGIGERNGSDRGLKRGRGSGSGASLLSPSALSSHSTLSASSNALHTQPSGSTPRARPRPRDSEDRLAEAQLLYLPGSGKLAQAKRALPPAALEEAGRAEEWIIPMSTVLAERAYAEVCRALRQLSEGRPDIPQTPRPRKEAGRDELSGIGANGMTASSSAVGHGRTAIVLHPANLVKLRTKTAYAGVNSIQRAASKETAQLVQEGTVPMLTTAAFPENSRFRLTSLHNILSGNEAYKLTWNWGLLNWEDEYFHLLAAVCHLQQKPETCGRKYRVLVRKIKPHMAVPAKRLRVELVDMAGLLREVRAKLKERDASTATG